MKPLSDSSSLNISLPMLIQAVAFIGTMIWGFGELNGRISFLEYQVKMNEEHIMIMEEEAALNQDAEIPADIRQDEKINFLQKEVEKLRNRKYEKLYIDAQRINNGH